MRYFSIRFIAVALTFCVAGGLNAQRARNPIDRANFDTTCAACADFYTFANGGWLKRSTIPAAYSSWGSFNEVQDKNELVVRDVIAAAFTSVKSGTTPPASNAFKIGAYYEACVDTLGIDALGTKPIDATMARIAKIASASDLPVALAELEATDGLAPCGVGAGAARIG